VCIDEDLSWKFHTSYISLKISKGLGILNKLKFTLPHDALLTPYRTMIEPHLCYPNIFWGGTSQIALVKLQHLQKRAIRLITFSTYRAPTNELFRNYVSFNCMICLEFSLACSSSRRKTIYYLYHAQNL